MTVSIQYPGVYLQEVASRMHPIEGVTTATADLLHVQEMPNHVHPIDGVPTAAWTDHNAGDPGVTLLDVFTYLGETLTYRAGMVPERDTGLLLQLLEQSARDDDGSATTRHKPWP